MTDFFIGVGLILVALIIHLLKQYLSKKMSTKKRQSRGFTYQVLWIINMIIQNPSMLRALFNLFYSLNPSLRCKG